jgi:hypothetical protein
MEKRSRLFTLWLGISVMLFSQCKVFDNEVMVPGYVYVPGYRFQTKADGSQGDSTSNITDVWMYSQGNIEGAFAVPALIPVQHNGPYEIAFDAGILRTGQFYERIPNKLMTREYFTVDLKPGKIDTLFPTFKYSNSAVFKMIEDFDRLGFRFYQYNPQPGDTIVKVNSGDSARVPGHNSGMVKLTDSTTQYRLITTDVYTVNSPNSTIYLELDYNTDTYLHIGFVAASNSGKFTEVYTAYPTNGWKKVYIDMSSDLIRLPFGDQYRLVIYVLRDPGTPAPKIILDNIKLIEG